MLGCIGRVFHYLSLGALDSRAKDSLEPRLSFLEQPALTAGLKPRQGSKKLPSCSIRSVVYDYISVERVSTSRYGCCTTASSVLRRNALGPQWDISSSSGSTTSTAETAREVAQQYGHFVTQRVASRKLPRGGRYLRRFVVHVLGNEWIKRCNCKALEHVEMESETSL